MVKQVIYVYEQFVIEFVGEVMVYVESGDGDVFCGFFEFDMMYGGGVCEVDCFEFFVVKFGVIIEQDKFIVFFIVE